MTNNQLNTQSVDGVEILALTGRFDAHQVPKVQAWLTEQEAQNRMHILINLNGVTFIDTRALSLLVTGMKRCRQNGGDLRLCALPQPVLIIFEMTHLDRAFAIFGGQNQAVASFARHTAVAT